MAGKCVGENVTLPEHERVNIMDSGGLWKVNENFTSISKIAERYFKITTKSVILLVLFQI